MIISKRNSISQYIFFTVFYNQTIVALVSIRDFQKKNIYKITW